MTFDMQTAVADIGTGLGLGEANGELPPEQSDAPGNPDAGPVGDPPTADATPPGGADGAAEGAPENSGDEAVPPAESPPAAPTASQPPKTWRAEAAAKWATTDPLIQAEILKREEDFFKGIEGYKTQAEVGKRFEAAIAEHLPILQHFKIDPIVQVQNLMMAHRNLALGRPEDKVAIMRQLASDYGVDIADLASPPPYQDPEVATLRQKFQELQSQTQRAQRETAERARADAEAQIAKFEADPKNVYFKEVADDIARLIQSGVCRSLEEAYEKAVWANPTTRAKEQARLDKAKADRDRGIAEARAAAARKASAANVRTSQKSGSGTAPLGTIDDTLSETLKAIRTRH
jgi:hypothetical protein